MTKRDLEKILTHQDEIIGRLTRQVEHLQDTVDRYNQSTSQKKRDAGCGDSVSFDVVWKQTLIDAQRWRNKPDIAE